MLDKITNLVKQMSENEKQSLFEYIQKQYYLGEKTGMLKDDIIEKVIGLLYVTFEWIEDVEQDSTLEKGLNLDAMNIKIFMDILLLEFDLEEIEFSKVMELLTVDDIVNLIEDALENKDENRG